MITSLYDIVRDVQRWVRLQPESWRSKGFRSVHLLSNMTDDEYKRILGSSTFSITEANSLVLRVIKNRKALVEQSLDGLRHPMNISGRFLQHNFQETTYSCTPLEATSGFFDSLDIPPWDFWVGLKTAGSQHFLYAWIPTELVELVDRGVQCSAEENILWLEGEPIM